MIFSYLSPHFYTHNVKIVLITERTDVGIHQRQKISSESLKGLPVLHCSAEVMHIDF